MNTREVADGVQWDKSLQHGSIQCKSSGTSTKVAAVYPGPSLEMSTCWRVTTSCFLASHPQTNANLWLEPPSEPCKESVPRFRKVPLQPRHFLFDIKEYTHDTRFPRGRNIGDLRCRSRRWMMRHILQTTSAEINGLPGNALAPQLWEGRGIQGSTTVAAEIHIRAL